MLPKTPLTSHSTPGCWALGEWAYHCGCPGQPKDLFCTAFLCIHAASSESLLLLLGPGPRIRPASPALWGRFLTTRPPGKSPKIIFKNYILRKVVTTHIINIGLISSIYEEALINHDDIDIKPVLRKENSSNSSWWKDAVNLSYKTRNANYSSNGIFSFSDY